MSWIPATIISNSTSLRSLLRQKGILKHASVLKPLLSGRGYEGKVDQALDKIVESGDVVWDVGANVGLYTERFAEAVGPTGRIVAFEPIDTVRAALALRVKRFSNVSIREEALGSANATIDLVLDADPLSAVNSLARANKNPGSRLQRVRIVTADEVARSDAPVPNVVKVDTEGFEEEVIWGMRETLKSRIVRSILLEVHFSILHDRGYRRAPARISSILRDLGFSVSWVDPSHLLARRR